MTAQTMTEPAPPPAKPRRPLLQSRVSGVLLVLALLVLWDLSARFWVDSTSWPTVTAVLAALFSGSADLFAAFTSTISLMLKGFVLGALLGVAGGIAIGLSPFLRRAFTPLLEFLRPLPVPGIVPPLILLLGIDDAMKITVVAFSTFFPVLINAAQGVRMVDPVLIDMTRTFRHSRLRSMWQLTLPAALPYVFSGLRISLALALIVTVVAEMIAGGTGIGYYLMTMQYAMQPDRMYAGVVLLAATGYALNWLLLLAERRLLHWYTPG